MLTMDAIRRRILIVEDHADSREIFRILLEHRGYEVVEATTGLEGLDRARTDRPDLILMDISVPGIDGWEATRRLKQDEATRAIPIIILTAHALAVDRAKAEEAGCDAFFTKPVAPSLVLQEVATRLARPAGAQSSDNQPR